MKFLKLLSIVGVFYFGLSGCCTAPRAQEWEYKVAVVSDSSQQRATAYGEFLNDLGKEGWILVQREEGIFFFKRAKR